MKIVFLDVDGVLNTSATWGGYGLHQPCVMALIRLIERTGAKIVVSSTWRLHAYDMLIERLTEAGLPAGTIIDRTPHLISEYGRVRGAVPRGREIAAWLAGNPPVESFVILDDGDDMEHLTPHLIRTSMERGLTDGLVDRVAGILDRKAA